MPWHGHGGHEGYASPRTERHFKLLRCIIFSGRESGAGQKNETATAVAALRAGDNWQVLCDERGLQATMIAGHGESISSLIAIENKTICSIA